MASHARYQNDLFIAPPYKGQRLPGRTECLQMIYMIEQAFSDLVSDTEAGHIWSEDVIYLEGYSNHGGVKVYAVPIPTLVKNMTAWYQFYDAAICGET